MADFQVNNLSYTDKDFNAIYAELLEMGDEFSAKWKPSATNESDPGIILIKQNAVIGDKLDYNIDKNILEAFPSSVTQEGIARQLFEEQLACPPTWYIAASGVVNFRYINDGLGEEDLDKATAPIPIYTVVQDKNSEVSYTIIDHDKTFSFDGSYNVNGYNVLQGTPNTFTYGIDNVISINTLDDNRRLYFQEYNVAENGVFVSNTNSQYEFWKVVELLSVQPYGSKVVKFGVDKNNRCYLEFPTWIDDIIGNGLYITYITTQGASGGVAAGQLTKFAVDITLTPTYQGMEFEDITLNSDNVQMQNPYSINNGRNPDTIDEVYKKFQKVVGTFNTLVTIRDYNNAMPRDIVGNGFACDRTNDIQSAYKIVHTVDDNTRKLHKRDGSVGAYDIKLYMTKYVDAPQTIEAYKKTFEFVDNFGEEHLDDGEIFDEIISPSVDDVIESYDEDKCISQEFETVDRYKPLFFKNKYPINCTVIPIGRLSEREVAEIKRNIVLALYDRFNGTKMSFGEEVEYDDVYNTILNADSRISAIHLQDLTYTTYAVYRGSYIKAFQTIFDTETDCRVNDKLIEVPVNQMFYSYLPPEAQYWAKENNGVIVVGHYNAEDNSFTDLRGQVLSYGARQDEFVNLDGEALDKYIYFFEVIEDKFYPIDKYNGIWHSALQTYDYPFGTAFATDIYAKSILNGNTPFIKKDTTYVRSIEQKDQTQTDAYYIDTNAIAQFNNNNQYVVKANENIQIFSPSYGDKINYAFGSKMQYKLANDIPANTDYVLGTGDELLVFWRSDSNSDYQWRYYHKGDIIRTDFRIFKTNEAVYPVTPLSGVIDMSTGKSCGPWLGTLLGTNPNATDDYIGGTTAGIEFKYDGDYYPIVKMSGTTYNADTTPDITTVTQFIEKLMVMTQDAVSAQNKITEREQIKVELNNQFMYFWILNSFVPDNSYPSGYKTVLFQENEDEYTLMNGEYLIYTNLQGTALYQLGAGTKITRDGWTTEWACDRVDLITYFQKTEDERRAYWQRISAGCTLTAYEQLISSFGEGTTVKIEGFTDELNNVLLPLNDGVKISYQIDYGEWQDLSIPQTGNKARTALQLVCSNDKPQKLEDNQSIAIYTNINASSASQTITGQYVLTSRACDYEGIKVNVQSINALNDRTPLGIMSYTDATSGNDTFQPNNNGGINFHIDSNATFILTTNLFKGTYLLPFKFISSNSNKRVTVQADFNETGTDESISDIFGTSSFEPNKQYYLDISVTNYTSDDKSLKFINDSGEVNCIVGALIPYTMTEALDGEDAGDGKSAEWHIVLQRMKELDPQSQFDFGYEVIDSELIENPLDPIEFNNPHHIMNPFTICEMDIDAMGENLGSIKILNNAR